MTKKMTISLYQLLKKAEMLKCIGNAKQLINMIQIDSRIVKKGDCFVAIKGVNSDGHTYIEDVISKGALVIVCQVLPKKINDSVTYIVVKDSSWAAGEMLHRYYGEVSKKINIIGVTGTNGKTTIATLLFDLFKKLGYKVGLLSTVENKIQNKIIPATHTTPDVVNLHRLLFDMYQAGCEYVFMECSSHAIDQNRISGIIFKGGVFTNITHDHLDYHKTFAAYIKAKKKFFDELPKNAFALVNGDDKNGKVMLQNTKAKKLSYSIKTLADYSAKVLSNSLLGLELLVQQRHHVHFKMMGEFNAYNLLAVYGVAVELNQKPLEVLKVLSVLTGAKGRLEHILSKNKNVVGIVDYAHTPDALEKVLLTLNKIKSKDVSLVTVVGCGGNRDKTKRSKMAAVAAINSDRVIFTSDNPRNEKAEDIINDMMLGVAKKDVLKVKCIIDRKKAIIEAVKIVKGNGVVLVAGKGHENYQEINGKKYPFSDQLILKEIL